MPRKLAADRMIPERRYKPAKIPTDLYFVQTECAERHIKIGIASNMKDRLSTMQTHCPYQIKLIKLVPGGAHMEKELHIRFAQDKLVGEWFRRSEELLSVIDSLDGITSIEKPPVLMDFDDMRQTWIDFTNRTGRYEGLVLDEDGFVVEHA